MDIPDSAFVMAIDAHNSACEKRSLVRAGGGTKAWAARTRGWCVIPSICLRVCACHGVAIGLPCQRSSTSVRNAIVCFCLKYAQ